MASGTPYVATFSIEALWNALPICYLSSTSQLAVVFFVLGCVVCCSQTCIVFCVFPKKYKFSASIFFLFTTYLFIVLPVSVHSISLSSSSLQLMFPSIYLSDHSLNLSLPYHTLSNYYFVYQFYLTFSTYHNS